MYIWNISIGVNDDWDSTYAKRDILEGEELLDDYGVYDHPEWLLSLYKKYDVPNDFVVNKILVKTHIIDIKVWNFDAEVKAVSWYSKSSSGFDFILSSADPECVDGKSALVDHWLQGTYS